MDPIQCAEIMLRALMKGDENLVKETARYAEHMIKLAQKGGSELGIFGHALQCSLCFSFNMNTNSLIPIEQVWEESEKQDETQHPWNNDWRMVKN